MARRKRVEIEEAADDTPERAGAFKEVMGEYFAAARRKTGRPDTYLTGCDAEKVAISIPLQPWCLQWLLHNDGFVLGRSMIAAGESGSCKTSFLYEAGRWHLAYDPQAIVQYNLAEPRDTPTLRRSQVGADLFDRYVLIQCGSMEEWQDRTTGLLNHLEKTYSRKAGRPDGPEHCMCVQTDSITGATSQMIIDGIKEKGHASLNFAIDANLLNSYLKYLYNAVTDWPMSWLGSSHIKFESEKVGMYTVRRPKLPGGATVIYTATIILMFRLIRPIIPGHEGSRDDVHGGNVLGIKTHKNSLGEKHKEIEVEQVWWYQDIPKAEQTENGPKKKQVTVWDWDSCSVRLLKDHLNNEALYPGLGDIVEFPVFQVTARKASCPAVGIRKPAPWYEVGAAVAADAGVMARLRDFYSIHRTTPYRAGVPWLQQIRDAIASGQVREAAPDAAEGDTLEVTE